MVCPDDNVHAQEAIAAIAKGAYVVCAALSCPSGQCCYVQSSPTKVCVAQ